MSESHTGDAESEGEPYSALDSESELSSLASDDSGSSKGVSKTSVSLHPNQAVWQQGTVIELTVKVDDHFEGPDAGTKSQII